MQFVPRVDAEPATLVVDFETNQKVVTFWHEHTLPLDAPVAISFAALGKTLTATHVGMWWDKPSKYSIEGYDDALRAIRRVHECRQRLIGVIKGEHQLNGDSRLQKDSVATENLHIASSIMACDVPLLGFQRRTFIFGSKAAPIAALIHEASEGASATGPAIAQRKTIDSFGRDLCIDWMLAGLCCRDQLARFVRQCTAQIEKRDGDRVLRLSSRMPKILRREFTRRW
jgi:hypothetical protein